MVMLIATLDGRVIEKPDLSGPAPVPSEVTNSQARRALRRAGLFDRVDAAVKQAGGEMLDAWEYANVFYRSSSFIAATAGALELTAAQIDDLFRAAAAIE